MEIGSIDTGTLVADSIEIGSIKAEDLAAEHGEEYVIISSDHAAFSKIPQVNISAVVEGTLPTYANWDDAGMDLYASHDMIIRPQERALVGTGLKLAIPAGIVGLIHPRSGLALKHGLTVLNTPGTIDPGYRGEIKVILFNTTRVWQRVNKGDRIAQIVFQHYIKANLVQVESLDETERGSGGFGSTGN